MGTTAAIPVGRPFELSGRIVGLERDSGRAVLVARSTWSKPWRIDGYTIESSDLGGPPVNVKEMHPDADEFLYLVVPRGTWHRIIVDEPGQLINVTPGPGGQSQTLPEA